MPDEKIVLGTIDTIVAHVKDQGIGAPAVIVIGEVVAKHKQFGLEQANAIAV